MLPSQSPRPSNRHRHSYSARVLMGRKAIAGIAGVVILTVAIWILLPGDDEPEGTQAQGTEQAQDEARQPEWPTAMAAVTTPRMPAEGQPAGDQDPAPAVERPAPAPAETLEQPDTSGTVTQKPEDDAEAARETRKPAVPPAGKEEIRTIVMGGDNTLAPVESPAPRDATPGPAPDERSQEPAESTEVASAKRDKPQPPRTRPPATPTPLLANAVIAEGIRQLEQGQWVAGRATLTSALRRTDLTPQERQAVRERLQEVNTRLVFGPEVLPGDPFAHSYEIKSGDSLARITKRLGLQVDWRFLKRVNGIQHESRIQAGQRIKVITGPFHAVIDKSDYRLDLYLGEGEEQVYVRSFTVGLGEFDSTPTGWFKVRPDSKLVNPEWINPRTRERFSADDPANPIGEHWLGLMGVEDHNSALLGYGIHGTVEPESIGQQASMGCVRMLPDDVATVWEVLVEEVSGVLIVQGVRVRG